MKGNELTIKHMGWGNIYIQMELDTLAIGKRTYRMEQALRHGLMGRSMKEIMLMAKKVEKGFCL